MKNLLLLLGSLAFLSLTPAARAESGGGSPPPPPDPAQHQSDLPKMPIARREEEASARASRLQRMAAAFRSKAGLADDAADLKARLDKAEADLKKSQADVAALTKENAALKEENTTLKSEWDALEEAAMTIGDGKEEEKKASATFQKAASAINSQVSRELRGIGHKPASATTEKPEESTAKTAADVPRFGEPAFAAVSASYWSSRPRSTGNN